MSQLVVEQATGDLKKYATIAYESGRSLLRIVNEILDFSKIEAGKIYLHNEKVKL